MEFHQGIKYRIECSESSLETLLVETKQTKNPQCHDTAFMQPNQEEDFTCPVKLQVLYLSRIALKMKK